MTPRDEARRAMAITLGFDTAAAGLAMVFGLTVRWLMTDGAPLDAFYTAIVASAMFAGAAFLSFYSLGVHRQVWRHSGWSDAVRILQAAGLATLIFLPALFLWNRLVGIPRSAIATAVIVWLAVIFAGRMVALARSTQRPLQIFFARARPDAPMVLLIAQPEEAARIEMWNRRMELDGMAAAGEAFRNSVPAFADRALPGIDPVAQIPDLAQRGKERLSRFYERLDEVLAKTPYVAGESYSIADITALVAIDFAGWIKIQPAESLVNIAGWYGRVSSRPSASA